MNKSTIIRAALFLALATAIFTSFQNAEAQVSTHSVKVDSSPRVSEIIIDGRIYLPSELPATFSWQHGSEHTISLRKQTIRTQLGTRYVFREWSDQSTELSKRIVVNSDLTINAIFRAEYYLNVHSPYGFPRGQGWYEEGATVTFLVRDVHEEVPGRVRYVFTGWNVGETPWLAENSVVMLEPVTARASWNKQYRLQVSSEVAGPSAWGSGWYDAGSTAVIGAMTEYEPEPMKHKLTFSRWVGIGDGLPIISNPTEEYTTIRVDGPYTIFAEWDEWWYVRVDSQYGEPQGEGYYELGSKATISVSTPYEVVSGATRVLFDEWTGSLNSKDPKISLTVDGYKQLEANWVRQHNIQAISKEGIVTGSDWYEEGTVARVTALSPLRGSFLNRLVFKAWLGDQLGKSNPLNVIVDAPKTVEALYELDFDYPNIGLIVGGSFAAAGGLYWQGRRKRNKV